MNINLIFEILLISFAILAINAIIYSFIIFNLIKKNYSNNISVLTNSSDKEGLALTTLIASNPIRLASSEPSSSQNLSVIPSGSSSSQNLNVISSETNVSQNLNIISSETNVSQNILNSQTGTDLGINEGINTVNSNIPNLNGVTLPPNIWPPNIENVTPIDSITILNSQTHEQWREIAMELQQHPINTPAGVLQQIKFEELNILYSQDIIYYCITQTELRLLIEHLPAMSLFDPDINHFILTMMSYYHT